jgi:hypothetical protein
MIESMAQIHRSEADRQELHTLVDHIPAGDLPAARKILRSLVDPVELALMKAPLDDEPETEEELADVEKALSNPSSDVPMEEVLREHGL